MPRSRDRIQFELYRRNYKRLLPADKSARIVDIGCGDGTFLRWLKSEGYENIVGYDIDPYAVEFVKSNGIEAFAVDALFALKSKQTIDRVFMRRVIEHISIQKLQKLKDLAYGALKPNGMLVVETPNAEALLASGSRYADIQHTVMFSRHSLKSYLSGSFAEVEVEPLDEVGIVYDVAKPIASLALLPLIWSFGLYGYWYDSNFIVGIATKGAT